MHTTSSALLRFALATNLAFSLTCALTALFYSSEVAAALGAIPSWIILGVGLGLLVFSAGIGLTLWRLRISRALLISVLDLLWPVATLPLLLAPGLLTPLGAMIIVGIAAIVALMAVLQLAGVRMLLRAGETQVGRFRHCIRIDSSARPGPLWTIIRDIARIADYTAGLSASRLEGSENVGPGSVRVCTNTRGQSWAEEVTAFDDAEKTVAFRFRADADDFPFPLAALTGGWSVAARGGEGARVDVWWDVTPKQRTFGWLIVALMTVALDRDLPRIVAQMEAAALGDRTPAAIGRAALNYC